jgi:hypothetical protein
VYLYSVPEHDAIKLGHARNPSSSAGIYSKSYGFEMPESIQRWPVSSKDTARYVEDTVRKRLLQALPTKRVDLLGHNALRAGLKGKGGGRTWSRELLLRPQGLSLDHFEDLCGYVIENFLFHHREWGIDLDKSEPGLKEGIVDLVASLHGGSDVGKFRARFLFSV